MTSNLILITGLLILLTGVVNIGINRLIFKKSIVFHIIAVLTFPILFAVFLGFFVGHMGLKHFIWSAPVVLLLFVFGNEMIAKMLRKPLDEMFNRIDSLSHGDLNLTFNEKFMKGEHELAKVLRRIFSLAGSLKNIAAFADNVGKGNLNAEYVLLGKNDTLGKAMLDMRTNLQKAETEKEVRREEDERRNWGTQGVAKFSELLRANNDNIDELCHSIIGNLVKYIGANQAGIFILNDDNTEDRTLELKACYAYERRKFLQKTIGLGEGLVGTCFLERQSIYMTNLPKDYIHITSGLGDDAPRALLLTPLKVNEDVYGIIEIAAFKEFEPHVRDFVEKVAESIASTIGSVKVNMKTKKLLEQSKLQAEEMANQEEELRQNMEEMMATQEETRRRESELQEAMGKMKIVQEESEKKEYEMQQFHAAIFDSCNIIMFSLEGVITDVNEKLLTIYNGVSKSEVIGRHVSDFVGNEDYQAAWEYLKNGRPYEVTQKMDTDSGGIQNMHHKYMPICDRSGQLLWTLLILYRR